MDLRHATLVFRAGVMGLIRKARRRDQSIMKEFDYSGLKSEIEAFYDLKKTNSPYDYKKWKISSTDDNCLASKTSRILTRIRDQIEILCKDFAQDNAFEVRICKGASYFPKIPWIGVFFNGERATDGVYPFMSFPDAGIVIGCVESLVEPQQDFSKEYGFPPNVIGENRKSGRAVFDYLDEHYSKKSVCIEENALSENAI